MILERTYKMIDAERNEVYEISPEAIAYDGGSAIHLDFDQLSALNRGDFSGDILLQYARRVGIHGICERSVVLLKLMTTHTNRQEYCWASRVSTLLPMDSELADGSGTEMSIGDSFLWPWSTFHALSSWQQRAETARRRGITTTHIIDLLPPSLSYIPLVPQMGLGPLDIVGSTKMNPSALSVPERIFASLILPQRSVYPRRMANTDFEKRFFVAIAKRQKTGSDGMARATLINKAISSVEESGTVLSDLHDCWSTSLQTPTMIDACIRMAPRNQVSEEEEAEARRKLRRVYRPHVRSQMVMSALPEDIQAVIIGHVVHSSMEDEVEGEQGTFRTLAALRLTNHFFCSVTNATVGARIARIKSECSNVTQNANILHTMDTARAIGLRVSDCVKMRTDIYQEDTGVAKEYVSMPPKIGNVLQYLRFRMHRAKKKSNQSEQKRAKTNYEDKDNIKRLADELVHFNPNFSSSVVAIRRGC